MRFVRSIPMCVAATAATLSAAPARGQAVTGGSTRIEAPRQVRIMEDGPTSLLLAGGGVTFAIAGQGDGSISVTMPGFVRQSSRSSNGLLSVKDGNNQVLVGTTLSAEAFSVSVGSDSSAGPAAGPADGVTMILAQFN